MTVEEKTIKLVNELYDIAAGTLTFDNKEIMRKERIAAALREQIEECAKIVEIEIPGLEQYKHSIVVIELKEAASRIRALL